MLTATGLELRAGARLLIEGATFRVGPGDRVGLVGRNGAGKTTLCRVLAGEGAPAAGTVERTSTVGYLPQDPRTGAQLQTADGQHEGLLGDVRGQGDEARVPTSAAGDLPLSSPTSRRRV